MIRLLVDASNKEIGIGLFNNKKCLFEKYSDTDKSYNRQIMPMIKEAVDIVKMDINDIDLFGATLGPGSFTGIRVGIAVMRALSHGLHKNFYGVSVIDILLKSVNVNMNKVVLMDAGRNEFYFSYYDIKESDKIINYKIYDEDKIIKLIKKTDAVVFLQNDLVVNQLVKNHIKNDNIITLPHIDIKVFNDIIEKDNINKNNILCNNFLPVYIRMPDAEKILKKRRKK